MSILASSKPRLQRSPRFAKMLAIKAATFGTKSPYELTAINVSYTGLLVGSELMLPFQLRTLIELEIDLAGDGEKPSTIQCLALIVRSVKGESEGLSDYISFFEDDQTRFTSVFGIQIREMSDPNLRLWKEFIDSID